jgi:2-polyprenyl-6-methoxyphenol hydroxylase-like FAD-dependent oxidoreductase
VLDWEDDPLRRFRIYAGRGCRFVSYPVAAGKVYWLAMIRTRPGGGAGPGEVKAMLEQQFGGFSEPVPGLIAVAPETAILGGDIVDRDPVKTWGEGRVTMLGDAVHPMTPNQAMGACTAIEDGIVLTRHLSTAGADRAGALRAYEGERQRRTARLSLQSRRVGAVGHWRNPVACTVRDALMTVVLRTAARRAVARDIEFAG